MEVMGAAFTTIAQTSAVGGQGGPSDLQRFRAHHPPTFRGGGDPVVATIGSGKYREFWRLGRLPSM